MKAPHIYRIPDLCSGLCDAASRDGTPRDIQAAGRPLIQIECPSFCDKPFDATPSRQVNQSWLARLTVISQGAGLGSWTGKRPRPWANRALKIECGPFSVPPKRGVPSCVPAASWLEVAVPSRASLTGALSFILRSPGSRDQNPAGFLFWRSVLCHHSNSIPQLRGLPLRNPSRPLSIAIHEAALDPRAHEHTAIVEQCARSPDQRGGLWICARGRASS
jgi:hypothetical protein